jgi:hypothetical protein
MSRQMRSVISLVPKELLRYYDLHKEQKGYVKDEILAAVLFVDVSGYTKLAESLAREVCALPCLALPCLALPCLALPCPALPCLALPCLALPCLALPCLCVCSSCWRRFVPPLNALVDRHGCVKQAARPTQWC